LKATDALLKVSTSDQYQEFLVLRNTFKGKPKTEEEEKAINAAAEKVFQKFVAMVNPTISCIKGRTKAYGNEAESKRIFSERVQEFREAIARYCPEILPDFSDFMVFYLEFRFPNLWRPKIKNKKRSP
jgi:hypothetical protein